MSAPSRRWRRCRPLWFRVPPLGRILWILALLLAAPLQPRQRFDPRRLRALLVVRDLHSPLLPLVEALLAQGLRAEHILLLDSGSSAPACRSCLAELARRGCRWVRLNPGQQRYGPYVPWLSRELRREIRSWRYPFLLSDPDLQLPPSLPGDWLEQLFLQLNRHRWVSKVALPLATVGLSHPDRPLVIRHERQLRRHPAYRLLGRLLLAQDPGVCVCPTDTTLALYRRMGCFSTLSLRLPPRFAIRHLPWYVHFVDSDEYGYYRDHKLELFGDWSSPRAHSPPG